MIDFGDAGSITVRPAQKPADVSVAKSGMYDKEDGQLHYTVTVSTTQGTGGAVTVTDRFSGGTHAEYDEDSFSVVKVDADGNRTTVSGYQLDIGAGGWDGGNQQFTITGLPELQAGERYEISYAATPANSSGGTSVTSRAMPA